MLEVFEAQRPREQVSLPGLGPRAAVDHLKSARPNRGQPIMQRLFHAGHRGVARDDGARVVLPKRDHRPAVVPRRLHHVDFVAPLRSVLMGPNLACLGMHKQPLGIPMSPRPNRRHRPFLSDVRVVVRHGPVHVETVHLPRSGGQGLGVHVALPTFPTRQVQFAVPSDADSAAVVVVRAFVRERHKQLLQRPERLLLGAPLGTDQRGR